jgi:hypothetical protein
MEWVKAEDMSVGDSVFTPLIPPETNNEIGIVYGDVDSGDYDTDERLLKGVSNGYLRTRFIRTWKLQFRR